MKKYTKPTIAFQNIALSSGLSSACAILADTDFSFDSCPILIPEWGETIFNDTMCTWSSQDNFCYHVPTASSNIFES